MDRLKGKIAVVTGASLGIGKATAKLMAKEGAIVIVTDVLDKEGKQVVDEIKKAAGKAFYYHLDVSKEKDVSIVFADVQKKIGNINVLVNNAGIAGTDLPTDKVSEKDFDKLMSINVKGVFFCTKYAIPQMRKLKAGSIINLSSICGLIGIGSASPYHASKGAVRLLTKNDAITYASDNIRVNSIHPGYIWTPMVENALKAQGGDLEAAKKAAGSLHPLGHMGEPEDIAYGAVYLASDESKFVTGSELVIDGGYTAR